MKGASTMDGKMHGNRQMVERYNESKGHKPARPKETGGESGGEHEMSGHDEIKQVVEEHGPAHKISMQHDHEGQHSTVMSHHEDGHKHNAEFDGVDHHHMAHAHAAHAAGIHETSDLADAHSSDSGDLAMENAGRRSTIEQSGGSSGGGFMD
jgi:hypothetical protein